MGSVDKFEINLEHDIDEQYQYEPGELLRGDVFLQLKEPIKVKAIQIMIRGEATVSWEEDAKNPQSYRADEIYIEHIQNVLDARSVKSTNLGEGKHRFPIECSLPANLPSSFIGKWGSITYVVKATLKEDKKFGLSTLITSEPFLVLRKLDLYSDQTLLEPLQIKQEKRLWGALAFCLSGKVTAQISVNKTGHLPGEDIFMDAEITNDSPRIVKAVQAAIVMHSTFHAKTNTRYNTQIVNKKRDEWEMSYGEGRRWKGVRLTIPPYIPESRLDGCDIIDIRYELLFRVEISGNNEIRINIPLTVGTVQSDGTEPVKNIRSNKSATGVPSGNQYEMEPDQNGKIPEIEGEEKDENVYEDPDDIPMNGDINGFHDDIDINMDGEEAEKFRYPLNHGDTRRNPLFHNVD